MRVIACGRRVAQPGCVGHACTPMCASAYAHMGTVGSYTACGCTMCLREAGASRRKLLHLKTQESTVQQAWQAMQGRRVHRGERARGPATKPQQPVCVAVPNLRSIPICATKRHACWVLHWHACFAAALRRRSPREGCLQLAPGSVGWLLELIYLISLCTVWRRRNGLYFVSSRRSGVFLRFCRHDTGRVLEPKATHSKLPSLFLEHACCLTRAVQAHAECRRRFSESVVRRRQRCHGHGSTHLLGHIAGGGAVLSLGLSALNGDNQAHTLLLGHGGHLPEGCGADWGWRRDAVRHAVAHEWVCH